CSVLRSARRSAELSGGGLRPVPEPIPAVPFSMPGLSSRSSAGSVGAEAGRCALDRVGRAGPFLLCLAGSRGGLEDFAIAANMGGVAERGKARCRRAMGDG